MLTPERPKLQELRKVHQTMNRFVSLDLKLVQKYFRSLEEIKRLRSAVHRLFHLLVTSTLLALAAPLTRKAGRRTSKGGMIKSSITYPKGSQDSPDFCSYLTPPL